jgi:hypothetical protein
MLVEVLLARLAAYELERLPTQTYTFCNFPFIVL